MIDEIKAALSAAESYTPRNEGEEGHVLFIRALLMDAELRVSQLDDYANEFARSQAAQEAQAAAAKAAADLEAARTATAAPAAGPVAADQQPADDRPIVPDAGAPSFADEAPKTA